MGAGDEPVAGMSGSAGPDRSAFPPAAGGPQAPTSMPVLTLWQPWASLVAVEAKTIETRSWSTKYRGPLAISAAATTRGFDEIACGEEAGWVYADGLSGYQAAYCRRTSDEGRRGDTFLHCVEGPNATTMPGPCPLGVIVATCTLLDVVPIVDERDCRWDDFREPCAHATLDEQVIWHREPDELCRYHTTVVIEETLGDYTPGRFAWLLTDVEKLDEPVPFKGGQGLTRRWTHAQ